MSRIILEVTDEQKSAFVLELLSALDFVDLVDVGKVKNKHKLAPAHATTKNPRPHINPNRPTMLQEQALYENVKSELVKEYLGQYIAMFQGTVIDHDANEMALIERIKQTHPNDTVLIKKVSTESDRILQFRSPRFVREG